MCPKWMIEIFKALRCGDCKKPLFPNELERIGMEYRLSPGNRRSPFVILEIRCSCCQQTYVISEQRNLRDIIEAITACHIYLFQGPPKEGDESACAVAELPNLPHAGRFRIPPTTPMSGVKIRSFLKRLERTSFKRKTKSYRKWIRDLGVDIDRRGTGADDIPF